METHDVTLTEWHKMGHSVYGDNKNLYDYYWVKGLDVSVPSDWLEDTIREFGFDYTANILSETKGNEEQHEIVNKIIAKANEDGVASKPFLYYMRNKMTTDVQCSSTSDLLHDAYTCRELYFNKPPHEQIELSKKYPTEVKALTFIFSAVERELLCRFPNVDVDKELPDSYCYIEFLQHYSPSDLNRASLFEAYKQLYTLYCFFDCVKQPKKKSAAKDYEHCKIMKEALEIKILKSLKYASNAGLI